jgi:predicted ferric reductase
LAFVPGQFVFVAFGGENGWQRHPFTVSSSPAQRGLEVTIKASGDYTDELRDRLRPGVPAKIAGPFGGFDYRNGGHRQAWIAGGIGIPPFLSRIRSLDDGFDRDVDLYYSFAHPADELHRVALDAAGLAHPSLRVHRICSAADGVLTAERVLADVPPGAAPSIFMCGPTAMMRALADGLHRGGVPRGRIRWEDFGAR